MIDVTTDGWYFDDQEGKDIQLVKKIFLFL